MSYTIKTQATLLYSKTHEWVKVEGDIAVIGISDYAQHHLGSLVFVDLPMVGDSFAAGDEFGAVESVKAASELYLPVAGEVVAVNEALNEQPELLNQDCYVNFICQVKMDNKSSLTDLMSEVEYIQYCSTK